jgi:hypothetical protein
MAKKRKPNARKEDRPERRPSMAHNYDAECMCCAATPTVGKSRMCGPCYFGDASTAGGNW